MGQTSAVVSRRRWLAIVATSLVALLLALAAHAMTRPRITDVTHGSGASRQSVAFPFTASLPVDVPQVFAFHVEETRWTQSGYVIVPDDKVIGISVDGMRVPLDGVDPKKLADYDSGFRFPLGQYMKRGDNEVVISVKNNGGPGGLDVRYDPKDRINEAEWAAAAVALVVLFAAVLRRTGFVWSTIAIGSAGMALRLAYLAATPWNTRDHDANHHVEYVDYILAHHALPRAHDGYAFYHPPLYYLFSALQMKTLGALGLDRAELLQTLQAQSVLCQLGFSAFAIATGRLWFDRIADGAFGRGILSRAGAVRLFEALILFWPSAVLHSSRLGNDDMTYFFFGASVYLASRWWFGARDRALVASAAAAALGVVTKTNSVLLFPLIGFIFVARAWFRDRDRRARSLLQRAWPVFLLFVISTGLALGNAAVATLAGRQEHLFVANAAQNSTQLLVGNHAENYLWFDLKTFITQAFTDPWQDVGGRQYFWNYLLKTSLVGEWTFPHAWSWNLAVVLSFLLLCLGAHAALGMFLRKPADRVDDLPLFGLFCLLIGSLALLRMALPSSPSGDFRYVLPVLLPVAWWMVRSIAAYRERGWTGMAAGAAGAAWLFVIASISFVVVVVATAT